MMTEDERIALTTAAAEAERLRNDPAFQAGIRSLHESASAELAAAKEAVIEALLYGERPDIDSVRTAEARLSAVNGLMGEIAKAIARAPRKPMAVA
jgi:hypothetical protein